MGLYQALFKSDLTRIKKIEIQGANPQTEKRIRKTVADEAIGAQVKSSTFWKIQTDSVALKIEKDPWVESVQVKKVFPDEIKIEVSERTPDALIGAGSGNLEFVDQEGNIFGPAEVKDISSHVLISGKNILENKELRSQAITEVLHVLPEKGPMSRDDVSEIQFNSEKGFQIVMSKTGIVVDLGKENIPLHLDRARKVVQYLDLHQINATHVDADYAKKVLVKVHKDR